MTAPGPKASYHPSISIGQVLGTLFVLIFVFAVSSDLGQTPPPTAAPTPVTSSPAIEISTKDIPIATPSPAGPAVNVPAVYWTLRDAIRMALENNVDIAIQRKNLRIAEFNIVSAEGVYDPVFTAAPAFTSAKQPNIGRFSGVASSVNSTNTTNLNLNAGLNKQFQTGGGVFQSTFDNTRTTSNSGIVSPVYSPQIAFNFTQPLWRNRSVDISRLQIFVAKKNLSLSDSQFRQQVIGIIFLVQEAYWNLAVARRNVTVQSDGVTLAQKQVEDDQKQVEIGMLAPLDVVTVKAALETRRQALVQAQTAETVAQNALKDLVAEGTLAPIWSSDIFPTDFFEEDLPTTSLPDALASAYAGRPEIAQYQIQKEINRLNTEYYRNQTKPQINLVSSYSISGAGGTPTTSLTCPAGTTLASSFLCVPGNLQPTVTTSNVNPAFIGGYGTALGNLFSNKYNTLSVGLSISLPFHNRTAEANLGRSLVTESQTELQERKQLQTIEVDVRNAYQTVQNARKILDAARLARQYSETQLDGEQKKFASGLSTTFLVLTRQNELIQARGAEVNALAAFNNAISSFQQATGTTLSSNNVVIK